MFGGEDEAVNVAAEANGVEPEVPLIALGDRGRAGKAVDGDVFDGRRIDVLDPAGREVLGECLLGRYAHDVQTHRLAAVAFNAKHGLRGIIEGETLGRGESEAELGMEKAPAAHEALAWVLAKYDTVDIAKVDVPCLFALHRADAGRRLVLPRIGNRFGHALRGRRMRGKKIRRRRIDGAALLRFKLGIAFHRGEKARRAVRIVAGAVGDADADRIRFEL